MQSIVLPPTSLTTSQLGHPRFYPAPERLTLNYSLPTNARLCNPRDLPPLRPMSSSVPADDPLETPGTIRLPSPGEGTTVSTVPVATPVVAATSVTETTRASGSSVPATAHSPAFKQHAISTVGEETRPSFGLSASAPASQVPLATSEQRAPQHSASTFPPPTFGTPPTGTASRALSPKGTRRTKAHVASACVNCKKKHLGCDPARPCRRCVLSGKERSTQIAPMGPNFSSHLPAVRRENEPPTTESGIGESRPAKRRKMALDDMVND
ncbi:putative C6 transcription factor [Aspergillus clavatus NRRL 1]|uniref:Transcription activator of gluconeogenesis acuK n=1 Tax=Aspergillus clavatus (strain ATCC 1007 / CBS 513.65 / DSM 816 / NCTC 3887 / NRRL 1 / QM 1276 / 107) TaxID=344612 RepID=A1CTZ5_ASPCL|nr:C6 zinc finger domain protein [Aspergillus clavatus NRRL 1]EAW06782.1 C6 zinc finger domain protein [Aspergillus clavatus NRRL 1]